MRYTGELARLRVLLPTVAVLLGWADAAPGQGWPSDPWLKSPVDDETFQTFLDFFTYDRSLPFALELIDVEESDGIRKEHLSFQSTPGVRVYATFHRPVAVGSDPRPSVLLVHGGASAGKDAAMMKALASELVRGGLNVLAFDLLHFGERKTGLLTTFTEEDKHEHLYNQLGAYLAWVTQSIKDAGRAFDLLVETRNADPERIGLVGRSRGGQVGIMIGGADRRLAAVAALYAGHFDRMEGEHRAAACPANYIGRISPRPLFMVNGNYDSDYDKERSVLPLQRLAKEPKLILWADTGHEMAIPEHRTALIAWMREKLQRAPDTNGR